MQAVAADRRVRTDHRGRPPAETVEYGKVLGCPVCLDRTTMHGIDARKRRGLLLQPVYQQINLLVLTANLYFQALGVGTHPAGQTELLGQTPHQRAEANALDDTCQANAVTEHIALGFVSRHGIFRSD